MKPSMINERSVVVTESLEESARATCYPSLLYGDNEGGSSDGRGAVEVVIHSDKLRL